MKVNRASIPLLVRDMKEFENASGTLIGKRDVQYPVNLSHGQLNELETDRLRIDSDAAGLAYVIVSYGTPIAWVTKTGWTYKVRQRISQTSTKHLGLLYLLPEGFNPEHIW